MLMCGTLLAPVQSCEGLYCPILHIRKAELREVKNVPKSVSTANGKERFDELKILFQSPIGCLQRLLDPVL